MTGAEKNMKKSLALGGGALTKQAEGPNKLQLGMLMMQKGRYETGGKSISARPSGPVYPIKKIMLRLIYSFVLS